MAKVKSFADPRIQIRRKQNQKAKDLLSRMSYQPFLMKMCDPLRSLIFSYG